VDRCALFVDAGYALADGALAVHGTRHRDSVSWDYAGLLKLLAGLSRDRTGLPVLRCYWYEATVDSRRTAEHDALADIPGLKLRLGKVRPGRREGVETEIRRDLTALARNKAVSDVIIVSAEEDLAQVISDVQDQGLRVGIVHIATGGDWTISRSLRQECDDIIEISAGHLSPYVDLIPGAEPAARDDGPATGGYHARDRESSIGTGLPPVPQAVPAQAMSAPPSLYPAPVAAEYPRAVQSLGGSAQPSAHSPAHGLGSPSAASSGGGNSAAAGAGAGHPGGQNSSTASSGAANLGAANPGAANPAASSGAANPGAASTSAANPGAAGGAGSGSAQGPGAAPGLRSGQPGAGQQGQDSIGRGILAGQGNADSGRQGSGADPSRPDDQQTRMPAHQQYQMPEPLHGSLPAHGQPGQAQNGMSQNGQSHNGLSQNGLPQNGLPQNGLPHGSVPPQGQGPGQGAVDPARGSALPQQNRGSLPQSGLPQSGLPQNGLPSNGLPSNGLPSNGLPQNGLPQNGLPQNGLPQNGLPPSHAAPQNGLPQNGYSQHSGPLQGPSTGELPRGGGLPQHSQYSQPQHIQPQNSQPQNGSLQAGLPGPDSQRSVVPQRQLPAGPGQHYPTGPTAPYGPPQPQPQPPQQQPPQQAAYPGGYGPAVPPQAPSYPPQAPGPYGGPQAPAAIQSAMPSMPQPIAVSLPDAVQAAHAEGFGFGEAVARDAPALWLEAVLARKPRMPSDLEARLLQGSALPIDSLLHDEVRHALRRGFWDALERSRR
jgi:hypothetical protein